MISSERLHAHNRSPKIHPGMLGVGGAALFIGGLALGMPNIALEASIRGVQVWWDVLFPALFPFFVLSELLLGFGVVHLAGTLLDPLMRPLFRLPGLGGFVVAMGFVSGYPVGARLTARLMEQKSITRAQGERLVEMTTTSDPIFLIGAVSVGFFGQPQAAPILAAAHYGGALLLGLISRGRRDDDEGNTENLSVPNTMSHVGVMDAQNAVNGEGVTNSQEAASSTRDSRLRKGIAAMHQARMTDGRPLGVLIQQAIQSSLVLMMIVGGLVVFFSAALDLLTGSGVLRPFQEAVGWLIKQAGLPGELASSLIRGTFEVTLGAQAAAQSAAEAAPLALVDGLAAAAFVLSWAGLSVHAQVAGLMSKTGWHYGPFMRARLLHGILSIAIVYTVWPFFSF